MKRFCKFLAACLLLGAWMAPGYALTDEEARELYDQAEGSDAQALKALEQAAEQGDAAAQFFLGGLYSMGRGIRQDYAQTRYWWEKAAAQGHALAQGNLSAEFSRLYCDGEGVQNYAQARALREEDAEELFIQAAKGDACALKTLEQAAEQGNAAAQFYVGGLYFSGQGVPQDEAQGWSWYEKAAAQGYAQAQVNLGGLYFDGEGVPQDYGQARSWWEKAAAQGHAMAQSTLGDLYYDGKGVPQDYAQARSWWEKAAGQDVWWALYNLGALYENGQGVPQDKRAAKAWYGKACEVLELPGSPGCKYGKACKTKHSSGCEEYQRLDAAGE